MQQSVTETSPKVEEEQQNDAKSDGKKVTNKCIGEIFAHHAVSRN